MIQYYIINNDSRANQYGIGTYINQMAQGLLALHVYHVTCINLCSEVKELTCTEDEYGIRRVKIPRTNERIEDEIYCRTAYYLLQQFIKGKDDNIIFHFNYFQHYDLARMLKARFIQSKIILSIHYLNWCFEINGNLTRFKEIITTQHTPTDDLERKILIDFQQTSRFLRFADEIIVLSQYTLNVVENDYHIRKDKLHLIYNGFSKTTSTTDVPLWTDSGIQQILFVGRLDSIKGVNYLIKAFRKTNTKHPKTRLVLVGDGDFPTYLNLCNGIWDKVIFTGKVSKEILENIYRHTTIGVLPSFHEQCSYSAIEMMSHGIPMIVSDSTGLQEMMNEWPELIAHISETQFSEENYIEQIVERIDILLSDEDKRKKVSQSLKKSYENKYTEKAMIQAFDKIIIKSIKATQSHISEMFLTDIDDRMIYYINTRPDIDIDFYGMTGIGAYLWWRTENGNHLKEDAYSLYLQEYLIYYLDWLHETVEQAPTTVADQKEMSYLLQSMRKYNFYPTRIDTILSYFPHKEELKIWSTTQLLSNALKIYNCNL